MVNMHIKTLVVGNELEEKLFKDLNVRKIKTSYISNLDDAIKKFSPYNLIISALDLSRVQKNPELNNFYGIGGIYLYSMIQANSASGGIKPRFILLSDKPIDKVKNLGSLFFLSDEEIKKIYVNASEEYGKILKDILTGINNLDNH